MVACPAAVPASMQKDTTNRAQTNPVLMVFILITPASVFVVLAL
jgi:hypothetical protein